LVGACHTRPHLRPLTHAPPFITPAAARDTGEVQSTWAASRTDLLTRARGTEEETLVDRARAGDPDALGAIARAEAPRVARLISRLLGPRSDLDDLVQTVFLELCRALPDFRGDSRLSTFVAGIAIRVARRAMRPTAFARRRAPMPDELHVGSDARTDDSAHANEQLRRVRAALEELSTDKRVAFLLWALEGLDPAEIGAITGASVPAVRSRIFYARKELRRVAANDPYLRELVDASTDEGSEP